MKKNNQRQNSDSLKIPIDNLSSTAFSTELAANERKEDEILESRKKKVTSSVTIVNETGKDIQFTEFDRAVLDVCIAERASGNEFTTPRIIFHQLGGGDKLTPNMKRAILDSIERLASVRITVDMSNAVDKKIYLDPRKDIGAYRRIFRGYLLPTESVDASINGQDVSAIRFLGGGILRYVADIKNQIIACPKNLLSPPVRATPRTVALNHYLLRRSLEIKGSNGRAVKRKFLKPLRRIITLQDMCEKCGIPFDDRFARRKARDTAEKILSFFVESKIIKGFHFEEKDSKIHSIVIEI